MSPEEVIEAAWRALVDAWWRKDFIDLDLAPKWPLVGDWEDLRIGAFLDSPENDNLRREVGEMFADAVARGDAEWVRQAADVMGWHKERPDTERDRQRSLSCLTYRCLRAFHLKRGRLPNQAELREQVDKLLGQLGRPPTTEKQWRDVRDDLDLRGKKLPRKPRGGGLRNG